VTRTPRLQLVALLADLWAETGNAIAFVDEVTALCREARGLSPVREYTDQKRRWLDGRRIYDARRSLRLTQRDAAARRGVSAVSLSNWENGRCYCDADVVINALTDPANNKVPRRFVAPDPRKEDRP